MVSRSFVTAFYTVKPFIPRIVQIAVRSRFAKRKLEAHLQNWPVDPGAACVPERWNGWPDGKQFALLLIHDVDTHNGMQKCREIMELEEKRQMRSTFFFVPERYETSASLRKEIVQRGNEIGVHGLVHDGKLFRSRPLFSKRASRINEYISQWGARGFSAPSMHCNPQWLNELDVEYSISTLDTDPFEPNPCISGTIFPFYFSFDNRRILELSHTMVQDFTLFILLRQQTITIWKQKLDWIAAHNGMALLNTHPDYMNFGCRRSRYYEYDAHLYEQFLQYVMDRYGEHVWITSPSRVSNWMKSM